MTDQPKLSALERIQREACPQGCGAGLTICKDKKVLPTCDDPSIVRGPHHHPRNNGDQPIPCTAPTPEAAYEELARGRIQQMPGNRKLDELVEMIVFDGIRAHVLPYTSDASASESLLERMRELGWSYSIVSPMAQTSTRLHLRDEFAVNFVKPNPAFTMRIGKGATDSQ